MATRTRQFDGGIQTIGNESNIGFVREVIGTINLANDQTWTSVQVNGVGISTIADDLIPSDSIAYCNVRAASIASLGSGLSAYEFTGHNTHFTIANDGGTHSLIVLSDPAVFSSQQTTEAGGDKAFDLRVTVSSSTTSNKFDVQGQNETPIGTPSHYDTAVVWITMMIIKDGGAV